MRGFLFFVLSFSVTVPSAFCEEAPDFAPDRGVVRWNRSLMGHATDLRLMCVAAHPDDEDGETLAYYNRSLGVRTSILLANWGEGGQNEIGPELYEELGVIRSRETLEASRLTGAVVYCLNQKDFGYSKTLKETWEFWDHAQALERTVRILRTERPHVVITNHRLGRGHGNHQATAALIEEAIPLAASSEQYVSHFDRGLSAWKVERLFQRRRHHEGNAEEPFDVQVPVALADPLRGISYQGIASQALNRHRSQGAKGIWKWVNQRRQGAPFTFFYLIVGDPPLGAFDDLFDGMEGVWWMREGWGPYTHEGLISATPTLEDRRRKGLQKAYRALEPDYEQVETGLREAIEAVRALPAALDADPKWENFAPEKVRGASLEYTPEQIDAYGREVVDRMRALGREQTDLENLLSEVWGLEVEIEPPRAAVYPGANFETRVRIANRGDREVRVESYTLELPSGWSSRPVSLEIGKLDPLGTATANFLVRMATDAEPTLPETVELYRSSQPWKPNLRAGIEFSREGFSSTARGEHRLEVSPAWEVRADPENRFVPRSSAGELSFSIETRRLILEGAECQLTVGFPDGSVRQKTLEKTDARRTATGVSWEIPDNLEAGVHLLEATLETPSGTYRAGSTLTLADVETPPDLKVGVVQSYDETLPLALETLGVLGVPLGEADLKSGDLDRFDTILVDIRGYLEREDLRENNRRLLAYVERGGHLVVFYHKSFDWNDADPPYAPYPLRLSRDRVTNERAPVRLLEPDHPLFNSPNKIGPGDWNDWVHERGLYFPGEYDPRYQELLAMADPGEEESLGSTLWAEVGEGTYVYTGLVFYRQLQARVPGAYRLFANLISQPKAR